VNVFADSSALVKLYADEVGHHHIRPLPLLCVSQLARVEVPAALWRKHRMNQLSATDTRVLVDAFEYDYFHDGSSSERHMIPVSLTTHILDAAAHAVAVHGLRAYDAAQLATALAVRTVDPLCSTFAAFDQSLRTAAAVEGFTLLPA
jgi:hypothetical protein